jgi:hypothetical protein
MTNNYLFFEWYEGTLILIKADNSGKCCSLTDRR